MTNPDREELVKLFPFSLANEPDYRTVKSFVRNCILQYREVGEVLFTITRDGQFIASLDGYAVVPREKYEKLTALRRLASSEDAVKGGPEPVAWRFDHADGTHSFHSEKLSPGLMKHCVPLYTAPPSDAGMREALANLLAYAERNECPHESTSRGGALWTICDDCGRKWADDRGGFKPYVEPAEITAARAALTAPGATTKSDGTPERFIDSAYQIAEELRKEDCPSDPSPTRSDVTYCARRCADELVLLVEAATKVANRTGNTFVMDRQKVATMIAGHFAVLLETHEIRRK